MPSPSLRTTPRILTTSSAVISTKYILQDQGYTYPLHLFLLQASFSLLILLLQRMSTSTVTFSRLPWLSPSPENIVGQPPVFRYSKQLLVGILSLAFSFPLSAQSLVHFSNLPTLVMLLTLILLVARVAEYNIARASRKAVSLAILVCVVGLVVFDDYRLSVNGVLFALAASMLFAMADILLSRASTQPIQSLEETLCQALSSRFVLVITLTAALVITCLWASMIEDTSDALEHLDKIHPALLLLNLILVASALMSTWSFCCTEYLLEIYEHFGLPSLSFFVAVTSLMSTFFLRPSFTSPLQIWSYFIMAVVLSAFSTNSNSRLRRCATEMEEGDDFVVRQTISVDQDALDQPKFLSATDRGQWIPILTNIITIIIWVIFALRVDLAFRQPIHAKAEPVLDLAYRSTIDLDVVVSMYQEDAASVAAMLERLQSLAQISRRSTRVIVYYKDDKADLDILRQELRVTEVIQRPNVGREGETYLYHIINNFDHLATHTLFIQAHVHNPWEIYRRIEHYFTNSTGMLSLGFSGNTCECGHCSDRWGWVDDGGMISLVHQLAYKHTCSNVLLSYKGQFIVSAQRIRGLDLTTYVALHRAISTPDSWAHKEPFLNHRPDSMNAPLMGFSLERAWSILMQCSELDIAYKCPSLISGTRRGGSLDDCQCLD